MGNDFYNLGCEGIVMIKEYCIKPGYVVRWNNDSAIEHGTTDACQKEVYEHARRILDQYGYKSVLDLGTGSGWKLMHNFSHVDTLGIDLQENLVWTAAQYPDRKWMEAPLDGPGVTGYDLLICADVVEHIPDPDLLMNFIVRCQPKHAIVSTPNRDRLQEMFWNGPPKNLSHCREWNGPEFLAYMSEFLNVEELVPPPVGENTQYVIGVPK